MLARTESPCLSNVEEKGTYVCPPKGRKNGTFNSTKLFKYAVFSSLVSNVFLIINLCELYANIYNEQVFSLNKKDYNEQVG